MSSFTQPNSSADPPPTQPLSHANGTLQPGDVIGEGFVIERTLGGGGMGQVYLARDPRLDRLVAVKLLQYCRILFVITYYYRFTHNLGDWGLILDLILYLIIS